MGTIWVREFRGGLDARRLPETSAGGTLTRGRDGHINRGGEFEQRSDFVHQYTLPSGQTHGLAEADGDLYVFGHQSPPSGLPSGVVYQRLQHPGGRVLADVPFWSLYEGKITAIGEFDNGDRYVFQDGTRITDTNAPPNAPGSGDPKSLLTHVQKLNIASGSNVFESVVGDPLDFGNGTGAGEAVIDMSTHAQGSETIYGLGRYDTNVAVFARRTIQIWFFDPDPSLDRQVQILRNTGTRAARSITQFGDGDVFYLDRSGIRSLRARDSSNSAATIDVGSAIDPLVVAALDNAGEEEVVNAIGLIEPRDGRFWLALGDTIYVLSYFSAAKISAWTEYKPGFVVDDMFASEDTVWLRSGDDIYSFGNTDGTPVFSSSTTAEMWLPYLDADAPTRAKQVSGIDAALRGVWEVRLACDPNNLNASDKIATISATTYGGYQIPAHAHANHLSLRLKSKAPVSSTEPALVSSLVMHFNRDPEEDSQ